MSELEKMFVQQSHRNISETVTKYCHVESKIQEYEDQIKCHGGLLEFEWHE